MNKKLGALALIGASAVVLAGCAGGSGGAPEAETGDLTVWLVGADTPQTARDYPQPRADKLPALDRSESYYSAALLLLTKVALRERGGR